MENKYYLLRRSYEKSQKSEILSIKCLRQSNVTINTQREDTWVLELHPLVYFIDKALDSCVKNAAWHNGVDILDRQGRLLDIISGKITSPHNP